MIWCIIIVCLLIAGILMTVFGVKNDITALGSTGVCILIVSAFAFIYIALHVIPEHTNHDANLAEWKAQKSGIEYQIENGLVIGDVLAEFNGQLAYKKELRKSPWTNWFVGDYVDELELIDVE